MMTPDLAAIYERLKTTSEMSNKSVDDLLIELIVLRVSEELAMVNGVEVESNPPITYDHFATDWVLQQPHKKRQG